MKNHISKISLCVAAMLAFFVASAQNERPSGSVLLDAVNRMEQGRYEEAMTLLKPLVSADPADDAALYYSGICAAALKDLDAAAMYFRAAVDRDPKNYWYKEKLARLYVSTSQFDPAVEIYEGLIKDYPKKTDIYYTLAQLYLQQNKTDQVLSTLDEIEAVSGKDEMVTLTKYDVLMRAQKTDEAYAVLESYNSQYSSPQILAAMGDHNLTMFRDTLAMACYQEALSYESDNMQAVLGISELYRFRGDYNNYFAAINRFVTNSNTPLDVKNRYIQSLLQHVDGQFLKNFKTNLDVLVDSYLQQAPSDSTVLSTVGVYFANTGRNDRARSLIGKCCELYPQSEDSRLMYVQLLYLMEDWNALSEETEKAYSDFPGRISFLEVKTMADYNLKDYSSLLKDNERIIGAAAPDDTSSIVSAYAGIGDVYHILGDQKKAFAAYEKALKVKPDYLPVLNNYAYYLSLGGKKLKKAYQMSKVTVELEPDNATFLDTFGWILYLQGKSLEAKPFFKHAMLYGGKDEVTILDHYAEVLYSLKEYDLARLYWNMAQKKNADGTVPDLDERVKARLDAIKK